MRVFTSLSDPELSAMLADGAIGVLPTDTVYGLVCRAELDHAITRMYTIKQRERQPGTTIAASVEQLEQLGFPSATLQVAKRYWPGAISVEMDASNISEYLKIGQHYMAARIPDHPTLQELLATTGPLMTTSANAPHQPISTTIAQAIEYFGDSVDFYVDGGDLGERPASTIIGFADDGKIIVYREGAVSVSPDA